MTSFFERPSRGLGHSRAEPAANQRLPLWLTPSGFNSALSDSLLQSAILAPCSNLHLRLHSSSQALFAYFARYNIALNLGPTKSLPSCFVAANNKALSPGLPLDTRFPLPPTAHVPRPQPVRS